MCRQTQKQWLGGVYHGTSDKDLATPYFDSIAKAYGLDTWNSIRGLMTDISLRPTFLMLNIDPEQGVSPQVRYGKSIEDSDPALPAEELSRIMA